MTIKLSANLGFLWKELPLMQRVYRAQTCGFDGVEFHDDAQHEREPEHMKKGLIDNKLTLCCMNTPMGESYGTGAINSIDSEGPNEIQATIDMAKNLDAKGIHVVAGLTSVDHKPDNYIAALKYVLDNFEGTVYIEPISQKVVPGYYLHTIEQAAGISESIGNERLKIIFDCYHIRHEHDDILEQFRKFSSLIGHVQIASFPSRNEPDTGSLDYFQFLKAIESEYQGFVGCEYNPTSTVEDGIQYVHDFKHMDDNNEEYEDIFAD